MVENQQSKPAPSFLLAMTATIRPAAEAGVLRADPALRLEDYERSLRFWLAYPHRAAGHIMLLENSGAELDSLRRIAETENPLDKPVEILSIPGNRIPAGLNYGYTEMELLDEGLTRSKLRSATTHLVKTTGRLIFPGLGRAMDSLGEPPELMVDCRKLGFPRRGFDASVQVFACSHNFYDKHLRDSRRFLNTTDVRLLEHLIYRQVIGCKGQPGVHLRFPCNIDPEGYSGFKGRRYGTPWQRVDGAVRGVLRIVAPWYWY